jgi:enoyl-CoA hydratase
MDLTTIRYAVSGHTARITLNRPQRLNAVTSELYEELLHALDAAEENRTVRVIVLTGEGRAFCVGADLKEHRAAERTPEQKRAYTMAEQSVCEQIQTSPKPVIAAVNGYALGAGAEIALSCDFVIMKETAEIGFPEISIGTYLGGGLTYTLPQLIGMAKARELVFLGKRLNGQQAVELGLIYSSAQDQDFEPAVADLSAQLSEKAPLPMSFAKSHFNSFHQRTRRESLDLEADALLRCMESEDWQEGIRAFHERRKPVFQGR